MWRTVAIRSGLEIGFPDFSFFLWTFQSWKDSRQWVKGTRKLNVASISIAGVSAPFLISLNPPVSLPNPNFYFSRNRSHRSIQFWTHSLSTLSTDLSTSHRLINLLPSPLLAFRIISSFGKNHPKIKTLNNHIYTTEHKDTVSFLFYLIYLLIYLWGRGFYFP